MRRSIILTVAFLLPVAALGDVATLDAAKDNTLYESALGTESNGSGSHVFVGMTSGLAKRRTVIEFDIAGEIPAGSTINSVTLTMYMSRSNSGAYSVNVHRLLAEWGEGTSDPSGNEGGGAPATLGDATWVHTFWSSFFWNSPGGDYNGISSGATTVGGVGFDSWSSAAMATDVQGWLDTPSSNHGWVLIGNETATNSTSKRFESRTNGTVSRRPQLTIDYTPPIVDGACCDGTSCSIKTKQSCEALGATFYGVATDCSPNPCLLTTGACCATDGSCSELPDSFCMDLGGTHQGNGTSCAPGVCPEPTGACCADLGSCSEETEADCATAGGTYQGAGSVCASAECPVILEPFVDALPIPTVAQPLSGSVGGTATYEIPVVQFQQQLHRDLPPTTLWGYDGQFPGPTIEAASGETVTVTWVNDLRDSMGSLRADHLLPVDLCLHGPNHAGPSARTVVHLHGAHVEAEFDGYPEDTILPGEQQVYVYGNHQLPATLWYHDHALGITRLNVYLGLAGFYLIRDPFEQSIALPSGANEIPLVIQDRTFNADGSLAYPEVWTDHFAGDTILVNGKVWPYLDVDQGKYRFRLLNGSGTRTYTLSLSYGGLQFQQIGTDGGLLPAPVAVSEITLAPAERADVVIDFEGIPSGTEILLTNSAPSPFPNGSNDGVVPDVMKFVVSSQSGDTTPLPALLRPIETLQETASVATRDFELFQTADPCTGTAWTINGLRWDDITEYPRLDTTEIWRFINRSGMMHPMHMHLVMFQLLDRQPFEMIDGVPTPTGSPVAPEPEEAGWKDTVRAMPNEITRVIARFEDYTGLFAYHCHILEHEDQEMMRQFQAIDCGDGQIDPTESCDDGNRVASDGCNEECVSEEFMVLTGTAQGGTVQIVVDGVTFYGITSAGQSAEQVLASLANSINSNSTLAIRGVVARVEGNALIVNTGLSVTQLSDPGLDDRLELIVKQSGLWWSRLAGSSSSDVVRGDLSALRGSAGDFSVATTDCLADNLGAVQLEVASVPPEGQGDWYLVRRNGASYDSGEASQVGSRDPGVAASPFACP